jgi:hypothetical protein
MKLSDGLSVRISIARWITPNGRRLDREHGDVVVPDVVVSPWKPSPGDDSLRVAIGERSDQFRRVFEEAVRRGEWRPAEDSTSRPDDRVLLRRLRKAGIAISSAELAGGAGLMEQEWAVLVAAHAESQQPATGQRRAPDAQLLAAWRMLEAGEAGVGGGR